jgi:hypothetical protein
VAFGARNPPGLAAVIDISEGENMQGCPVEQTALF